MPDVRREPSCRRSLAPIDHRALAKEDFNNDLKVAGEIGAGHSVVALHEVALVARAASLK